jgi:hypothetical protein
MYRIYLSALAFALSFFFVGSASAEKFSKDEIKVISTCKAQCKNNKDRDGCARKCAGPLAGKWLDGKKSGKNVRKIKPLNRRPVINKVPSKKPGKKSMMGKKRPKVKSFGGKKRPAVNKAPSKKPGKKSMMGKKRPKVKSFGGKKRPAVNKAPRKQTSDKRQRLAKCRTACKGDKKCMKSCMRKGQKSFRAPKNVKGSKASIKKNPNNRPAVNQKRAGFKGPKNIKGSKASLKKGPSGSKLSVSRKAKVKATINACAAKCKGDKACIKKCQNMRKAPKKAKKGFQKGPWGR